MCLVKHHLLSQTVGLLSMVVPGVQVGSYSPTQRVACLFYKAVLFFAAAFSASVVGHSLAKAAVCPSSNQSFSSVPVSLPTFRVILTSRFFLCGGFMLPLGYKYIGPMHAL